MFYNNDKIQTPDTELGEVSGSSALAVPVENAAANSAAASTPTGISNACCIGIAAGVTLALTLIPITTFLIVYYTRKDNSDVSQAPQKLLDNGTMCNNKVFIKTQSSIEEWLYSVDQNVIFDYSQSTASCYNNMTCVQNTISHYSNNYAICNNLYYFPGSFGGSIFRTKCEDIHLAFKSDPVCNSPSTVGYLTATNQDLFLCPSFVFNVTAEDSNIYNKIDLMNMFFVKRTSNDTQIIVEANSTLNGRCSGFTGDTSSGYDQNAILCMTELYLACN